MLVYCSKEGYLCLYLDCLVCVGVYVCLYGWVGECVCVVCVCVCVCVCVVLSTTTRLTLV